WSTIVKLTICPTLKSMAKKCEGSIATMIKKKCDK
uniref:Omega/M-ectatotoxin-Et1a subunit B n=1 Tax=Ectatomma tuberculatum TaxID=39300 RepID=TX1AB_ECTTU|nr:RecName: Full=Omega/M-ectatotoxin-Et1a subunit B; Short=Omega/M-ECTX-Et1a subunit B; AltName: Full=Ectatomin subunit B; Short=EA; AltName: Full=Ectatomin-Et1 subunit B [Ectatomma tuberculatum]AAB33089.1 ectatomin B [Ectatomma tuberculatum=ants, venom, Peptide, 34 aa] [Ectatomma tuberculatum]1ECI_B Chain B, ECTATOMIN [Ectatomma tuberculatum]prf//2014243B ectatomin:SUBUNIT=B [Ectatomma tuberculatum]prf//2101192B ectatomin B [Ectatomma tuberculatum]